jgi:hypothetical protein
MANEEMDEGAQVELDSIAIRQAMLLYNTVTDSEDNYTLVRTFAVSNTKVVVPVHVDEDEPEMPYFATLYKHEKATELHVYTSATLIPETCESELVNLMPLVDLLMDLKDDGDVDIVHVDPGTPHGVGFFLSGDRPQMFRLPLAEAMARAMVDDIASGE